MNKLTILLFLVCCGLSVAAQHPFDICGDGIDNDQDGLIDEACQPFPCDGTLYQTAHQNTQFILYRLDPSRTPMRFIQVANLTTTGGISNINSIGYNPIDNLIYGMPVNGGELYRIDVNGDVEIMGNTGLNVFKNAGTFDVSNNYYVFGANTLYQVDITNLTYTQVGTPGPYGSADIAYNALDGQLYGFNGNAPALLFKMDPNTAVQTPVPSSTPLAINSTWRWMGAMYFSPRGEILGYAGARIISFDYISGVGSVLQSGPTRGQTDGCSCSFGVELTKSVIGIFEPGDTVEYEFEIFNQSFAALNSVQFADTLAGGLQWVTEPYDTSRIQYTFAQSPIGSNLVELDLQNIPQGRSTFKMKAVIPCDYASTQHSNRAWLNNLPLPLEAKVNSDDPNTPTINDATVFSLRIQPITVQANVQAVICDAQQGAISLTTTANNSRYLWSTGDTTASISNLPVGNYQVTVSFENGCTVQKDYTILDESRTPTTYLSIRDNNCAGEQNNGWIQADSSTGGHVPYRYALDNGEFQNSPRFEPLREGRYTVHTIDQLGCKSQQDVTLKPPRFVLDITPPTDRSVRIGDRLPLIAVANTLTPVSYEWIPNTGLSCDTCAAPLLIAEETTTYSIIGTDILGCRDSAEVTITVDNSPRVFVPNAFSPNDDGQNDLLIVYSPGDVIKVRSFQIYTRWGECVFERRNFPPNFPGYGWDGTFRGQPLASGLMVYLIEVELVDGRIERLSGDVSLLR